MAGSIRRYSLAVLLLPLLLSTMSTLARGATITVTTLADSGPGSLRQAILDHSSGDTINFSVTGTINLATELPTITDTLTITGPGGMVGITIDGGGTVQLMQVNPGATLNLQVLTLADGSGASGGGAISNGGALTVTDCTFSSNQATFDGGAIFNFGTLTVTDSTFSGNQCTGSPGFGGAIYNSGATVTVANSTFSGNKAIGGAGTSTSTGGGAGLGGAIVNDDGTLTVSESTFSGNQATGGAKAASPSGTGGQASAGAILNEESGGATITNSTFSGNQTTGGAGGSVAGGISLGGAIENFISTLTITNCTFSGNQAIGGSGSPDGAGTGGAIVNNSTLTITNSTFSGNQATGTTPAGGAIENQAALLGPPSTVNLKSTILATSTPDNCGGTPAISDVGYNISDDSSCAFGSTSKNSNTMLNLVTPPSGNGGPTKTIALGSGSSAIGFDTNCTDQQAPTPQPVRTDQRLFIRPDSPAKCDSGAYEHDGVPPQPITLVPNTEHLQIARSTTPNSDQVNLALSFIEEKGGGDCSGENALNDGLMVQLYEGTCATMTSAPLSVTLSPFVVHTIGGQSYGTFFESIAPETVSARMVADGIPEDTCGEWSLDLEVGGLDTTAIGLSGGNPFALVLTDESGFATGCINIDNAVVGNQIPPRKVRRGVRR